MISNSAHPPSFHTMSRPVLRFAAASLALFMLSRSAVLLILFEVNDYSLREISSLFLMGMKFDLKMISTLCLPLFVLPVSLTMLLTNKHHVVISVFSKVLMVAFLLLMLLVVSDYGYYQHFGNGLDQLSFGLVEDGFMAVVLSMFDSSVSVILLLSYFLFLAATIVFLKTRTAKPVAALTFSRGRVLINLFILILVCMVFARGSFGTFPLSRKTNQSNADARLNLLALNALNNLYYAYKDKKSDTYDFSTSNVLSGLGVTDFDDLKRLAGYSVDNQLVKTTSEKTLPAPNVVFVLMEGWSSHIAMYDAIGNNVLGEFARHKSQDYFNPYFFSNSYGTNPTIERLLQNSPISPLSLSKARETPFSISNATVFKNAGYKTSFVFGGNAEWRRLGDFQSGQGFDDFYDRSDIELAFDANSDNPWGVFESDMFGFSKQVLAESGSPSFSFLLTTNNHPPIVLPNDFQSPNYDLSLFDVGFGKDISLMLDGYSYQSDEFGKFMTWLKASEFADNTIVVATGDHVLKGFANYNSVKHDFFKYAVPLYLYMPEKYQQPIDVNTVGSHLDIFPTLFELCLSEEKYFSFGQTLMSKTEDNAYGFNKSLGYHVIFPEGVASGKSVNRWDGSRQLLRDESVEQSLAQQAVMQQLQYQEAVAKYLLFQSYEESE